MKGIPFPSLVQLSSRTGSVENLWGAYEVHRSHPPAYPWFLGPGLDQCWGAAGLTWRFGDLNTGHKIRPEKPSLYFLFALGKPGFKKCHTHPLFYLVTCSPLKRQHHRCSQDSQDDGSVIHGFHEKFFLDLNIANGKTRCLKDYKYNIPLNFHLQCLMGCLMRCSQYRFKNSSVPGVKIPLNHIKPKLFSH